jgi:universal stress protein A
MNLNSMYENRRIAAPKADRYGHVKEFTSDTDIAHGEVSEGIPANQIVTGADFGPAIRVKRILAPTDLSDDSRKAVNYAVHLADLIGAQLTLVHFYDESWRNLNLASAHGGESMLGEQRTLKNNLYALRDEIRKRHRNCDCYFYAGSPSKEIPRVAKELKVDLVVISTHNPQGSSRWIFGSDAERIISHAPCPVLIVRQKSPS